MESNIDWREPASVTARLAQRVRELRKQRGWSVQQLANACAAAGMESLTRSTLAKIEAGIRGFVTVDELVVIAKALGEPVADLIVVGPATAGSARDARRAGGLTAASEPGPDDLSQVLHYLGTGRRASARKKLASQPETRMFLEAGLVLLRDDLLRQTGPDHDQETRSRLLESLSRERILRRAAGSGDERVRCLTVTMFRNRWPRKDDYAEDLIAYIYRPGPMEHRLAALNATITKPLLRLDLSELVRHIAAAVIAGLADDRLPTLQIIIGVALPGHPTVRRNFQAHAGTTLPRWAELYQRIAIAKGYQLRPGYTWPDMALLFYLVMLGVMLRARVYGAEPVLSAGERVLDAAILAMLPSLVEPSPNGAADGDAHLASPSTDRPRSQQEPEDLAEVLTHTGSGKLASTRRRLANDPDTWAFLELGVDLLAEDWLRSTGPDFDEGLRSRLFESLSRERVVQRAIDLSPGHGSLTAASFSTRWHHKDHYAEDLIAYLFRQGPIQAYVDKMSGVAAELIGGRQPELPDLIRRFAAAASQAQATDDQLFGLLAIIQAALPGHPRVRQDRRAQLDATLPRWAGLYQRIGAAYGLDLVPHVTWPDIAELFSLVIGGVLPWTRIYGDEPRLASGESAFAGALMAMLPALVRRHPGPADPPRAADADGLARSNPAR